MMDDCCNDTVRSQNVLSYKTSKNETSACIKKCSHPYSGPNFVYVVLLIALLQVSLPLREP